MREARSARRGANNLRSGRVGALSWIWMAGTALATTSCASSSSEEIGGSPGLTSIAVCQLSSSHPTVEVRNEASVYESTLPAPLRSVWGVMPAVFERLQIETNYIDPGAGTIGNGNFRPRRIGGRSLSTFIDCGSGLTGPYANSYAVRMSLLVQLGSAPGGGTTVRTSLDAYAEDRAVSARPIHCQSKGELERAIWALIQEMLPA